MYNLISNEDQIKLIKNSTRQKSNFKKEKKQNIGKILGIYFK